MTRTQPAWMASVVVGSVLRERSGLLRVVRACSRYKDGQLRSVTFTIRRCSWTRRCYTVLGYNDLNQRKFTLVGVTPRRLRSRLDRKIKQAVHQKAWKPYILKCCDVEGVA